MSFGKVKKNFSFKKKAINKLQTANIILE